MKEACEQRPKEVKEWLDQKDPQIAAQAKTEGADIYWGDQTGVNNQPNAVRGCTPRGETPKVRQMSKRFGSSMMSAVSNRGSSRWIVYKGALGSALLIRFLERLVRSMKGRQVYLIIDNLREHYLPSYSPELNPDERLNRSLKAGSARCAQARSGLNRFSPSSIPTPRGTPLDVLSYCRLSKKRVIDHASRGRMKT